MKPQTLPWGLTLYMRKILFSALCGVLLVMTVSGQTISPVKAKVGEPAPDFNLPGGDGKTHALADFKGKFIVLEWTNPDCPFVHKFYDSGAMQKFQKAETDKGVVWLRINSGAMGKEGYQTVADVPSYEQAQHVASTLTLLDHDGQVGHTYGARTTPHMFVINPQGVLIYAGGIDSKPSPDPDDIATAKNYVTTALDEAMAGKPVSTPTARPYGCGVQYGKK